MKLIQWTIFLMCLTCQVGICQIRPTGVRDSSFSVQSAYAQDKKNFPELSLADSAMPQDLQVFKNLNYTKTSAENLALDIFAPKTSLKKLAPAVLMVHGGGWRSGDRSHNYTLAKQLAARGFVTVSASYSLSTHALYPQAVYDLKNAVRWMRANAGKFGIDTARIAILGFSAGGQLAALVGTTDDAMIFGSNNAFPGISAHVQAIVDIDGTLAFIHPESGEGNDSKSISAATYWFGYPKTEKPELWQQAAPLNHVSKNTPPILFINSSVARMHAGRDDMIAKLNGFGVYSEVRTFPDAPHCFMFYNPWFAPTLDTVNAFLNRVFYPKH